MPRYRYTAVDVRGERKQDVRFAVGPQELVDQLDDEGWSVTEMELAEDESHQGALRESEARELAEQLADLTRADLPLPSGLRALGSELPPGRVRRMVHELADDLDRGEDFADVLQKRDCRFPGHLGELMIAGARSGRVGQVLGDFISYARLGASLRQTVWMSLVYPVVLISAFLALWVFLSTVVVGGFESIFKEFGVDLPYLTVVVLQAGHTLQGHSWQALFTPFILLGVIWLAARLLLDAAARRRLVCAVPLFGRLWRWASLAEFCHYLGLLLECNLPLDRAVMLAAEGSGDAELVEECRSVAVEIRAGASLEEASRECVALPEAFRKLLRWAVKRQSLAQTLHLIGDIYESQARTRAAFVSTVVTVVTVIMVLWGASILVVGLFLPLLSLLKQLSG